MDRRTVVMAGVLSCAALEASPQRIDSQLKPLADEIVSGCSRAGARRVTVADFTDLQGRVTELGRFVAEELGASLVMARPSFGVVDRSNLRAILAEHRLTMSGLVQPDTAKRLGQVAGVDGIIAGSITPLGDSVHISIKVIATDTATIITAARAELARTKPIEELLARGVTSLGESAPVVAPTTPAAPSRDLPSFRNRFVQMSARSANLGRNGNLKIVIQVENLTQDEIELYCHKTGVIPTGGLTLRDETGSRWYESDDFDFGSNRMLISPGLPVTTAATYRPDSGAGEGVRFDLAGVCIVTARGRENRFPFAFSDLQPSR